MDSAILRNEAIQCCFRDDIVKFSTICLIFKPK